MKASIPKNIKKYENKSAGQFTGRQFICLTIGAITYFVGFSLLSFLSIDIRALLCAIITLPIILVGFLKVTNIYVDEVIIKMIKEILYKADYRPFKSERWEKDV